MTVFVGDDLAEAHHDVHLMNEAGDKLGARQLGEGLGGIAVLHAMTAEDPAEVVVVIETDRGSWVQAPLAAGYRVYAIHALSVSRNRDRHDVAGAKSDPGDAKVLADLVRTDRHNHGPITGDTDAAEAVKILARAHQSLIWAGLVKPTGSVTTFASTSWRHPGRPAGPATHRSRCGRCRVRGHHQIGRQDDRRDQHPDQRTRNRARCPF